MSTYEATVSWRRNENERFVDRRYSRRHSWRFDGGAVVPASSSPHSVPLPFSDPEGVDPEEALVAALSSCHMLFFLSFAASRGWCVSSYVDNAIGEMAAGQDGKLWMQRITLRPKIVFEGETTPSAGDIAELHRKSHDACYIARSVKSEIVIEGAA